MAHGSGACVDGEVALNGCTVPGVGLWEEKLAPVLVVPRGPALSYPLAHSRSIFVSLPPASASQRRPCPSPSHGAGRGWGALTEGRHRAPCPAPAPDGGHGYPESRGWSQCPPKAGPTSPAFLLFLGLMISSCSFECTRAGSCPWDYCLEGDPLLAEPHFVPGHGPVGWPPTTEGLLPAQVWEEVPGSSRGLAPLTAPCQHLPAEPAQALQECGSATTRYCRNASARRVGKGRAGALLPPLSPSPSTQQPAAYAPCLGRDPPPLE